MADQKPEDVKKAAPVQTASQEPAKPVQPPAQAVPPAAAPSKSDVKLAPGTVPIEALHEERTARQQLQAESQQLQAEIAQLKSQMSQVQQSTSQSQVQVNPRKELEQLWDTDPRKAVQVEIMYAMDWRDRVDSGLEVQADQLATKYPDFNNYRGTTLNYVRNLPLNQRGTPGILEAAYYMVRGQNVDTLLQARESELMEKYRKGEITAAQLQNPAGAFSTVPSSSQGITLTEEQLRVAEMMGMTPESYASQIKLQSPQRGA